MAEKGVSECIFDSIAWTFNLNLDADTAALGIVVVGVWGFSPAHNPDELIQVELPIATFVGLVYHILSFCISEIRTL